MRNFFGNTDPARLVARWRAANIWTVQDDWYCPAVDQLAEAFARRRNADDAARALGAHRAHAGVSIRDGLKDLEVAYRIAQHREPPHAVARAFSEGWADAEVGTLLGRSSVDSLTGLTTYDYVRARLGEVYSEPNQRRRCFVIVDAADRRTRGPARMARSLGLSNLLRSVFSAGETTAVLPHGLLIALADECEALEEALSRLSRGARAFEGGESGSVNVWVETLPESQDRAEGLLLELDAA